MKQLMVILVIACGIYAQAETVFKIEVGDEGKKSSDRELRHRVWELERAVHQLQEKVFQLEADNRTAPRGSDNWVCTIKAMGDTFTATGGSKAVAIHNVTEECKKKRGGDGFFCKEPNCEQ